MVSAQEEDHLRSRKNVVTVGRVANTRNYGSSFRQRDLHAELVIVAMQVFDVLRNDLGFEILTRAASKGSGGFVGGPPARRLGPKVPPPGLAAGTGCLRQCLAMTVRSFEPTQ